MLLLDVSLFKADVHFLLVLIDKVRLVLGNLSCLFLLQLHFVDFVLKGLELLFLHFLVVNAVHLVLVFVLLDQSVLVGHDSVEVTLRFCLDVLRDLV